jgi:hypothetical protein
MALEKPTPAAMKSGLRKAEWKMCGERRREAIFVVVSRCLWWRMRVRGLEEVDCGRFGVGC